MLYLVVSNVFGEARSFVSLNINNRYSSRWKPLAGEFKWLRTKHISRLIYFIVVEDPVAARCSKIVRTFKVYVLGPLKRAN